MGSARSRDFFQPYADQTQLFNTIATPYGVPIVTGLSPLAMPMQMPWGLHQTIGSQYGTRFCVMGG
jgi:hypothetical protein